jgi:hypothetical protein
MTGEVNFNQQTPSAKEKLPVCDGNEACGALLLCLAMTREPKPHLSDLYF